MVNINFYKNEISHQIDVYTIDIDDGTLAATTTTCTQFVVSHVKALKMFPLTVASLITGSLNYWEV